MISKKSLLFFGLFFTVLLGGLTAQDLRITQIDTSELLIDQQVRLYLRITGGDGERIDDADLSMFTVYEAAESGEYRQMSTETLREEANKEEGITLLLLIDNSGSMYDTKEGEETENPAEMRISHAKRAVNTFLNSSENENDRIGLASFNTSYTLHSGPVRRKLVIADSLDKIERPAEEEAYTELYAALIKAAEELDAYKGRRAVIILSDGENFSYTERTGKPHPQWGDRIFEHDESLEALQRAGISVFAVNYGDVEDRHLGDIANESGGSVFDPQNSRELEAAYLEIRRRILTEFLLEYRAGMIPAEKTKVRVVMERAGLRRSDERYYYSSTVFGVSRMAWSWLLLIPFAAALFLWWLVSRLRFAAVNKEANLQILNSGEASPSAKYLPLEGNQTVIGGTDQADLTITGSPAVRDTHATIVYNDKTQRYTIVSEDAVKVNNRRVKKKDLKAGDVIDVGGTVIVFDDEVSRSPEE
jgi:Ca-activated chloride channel family protein